VPLQAFAVLIIDEAQNLPVPLLEEIRILSDLEAPEKLLQVVLVGQLELQAKLKLPEMRQVDQRVSVRCELRPMNRNVVTGYITHRIDVAGGGRDRVEFSSEAIDEIFRVSEGVPRLVNLICDRALHHGYLERSARIQTPHVVRATVDLGLRRRAVETHVDTKHEWTTQAWRAEQPAADAAPAPAIVPIRDAVAKPVTAPPSVARWTPAPVPAPVITPTAAIAVAPDTVPASAPVSATVASAPVPVPVRTSDSESASVSVPVSRSAPASAAAVSELMFADLDRESEMAPAAESTRDSRHSYVPRRFVLDEEEPVDETFEEENADVPRSRRSLRRAAVVFAVVLSSAAVLAALSYKQEDRATLAQKMALPPLPPAPAKGTDSSIGSLQMHIAASIAMSQNAAIYTIDVAGFNSVSRSTDLVEQLTTTGYKAYFEDRQFSQGRMYLVRVGPYLVQADAEADAVKIRQLPGYRDARVSVVLPPPTQ
jgi:cell division septation protein DedD